MKTYPPGSVVLVVHDQAGEHEEVYLARRYYDGGREYGHMRERCERWRSEAARERARELGIRCVRAFVPFPCPPAPPQAEIWARILALIRELRALW